ncbi:UTP--glucose-1-phosphate uridylyltransferase, partial [Candidatus Woesearchaeota archaeon]|nr:UTP--glucose-1-phosphate uridylyltransferase [Candidatus Woesearchaeota archaeon]
IEDLIEKPKVEEAPSNLAILGRYILDADIFPILEYLEKKIGRSGEIQLTDALKILNTKKQIYGYELEGKWYTVGDKLSYLKTIVGLALERDDVGEEFKEYLIETALRIRDPKS